MLDTPHITRPDGGLTLNSQIRYHARERPQPLETPVEERPAICRLACQSQSFSQLQQVANRLVGGAVGAWLRPATVLERPVH